jgi:hypothetical protein
MTRPDLPAADPDDLTTLVEVLTILEDFLLHAGADVADELARYRPGRPDDPPGWARWVAQLLGEHAATLHTLTTQPIGEHR